MGFNLLAKRSAKSCVILPVFLRPKPFFTDKSPPPQLLQYATEAIGRKPALLIIWVILVAVSDPVPSAATLFIFICEGVLYVSHYLRLVLGLEYSYRIIRQPLGSLASCETTLWHGRRHVAIHDAALSIRDRPDSVERLLHQRIQLVSSELLLNLAAPYGTVPIFP